MNQSSLRKTIRKLFFRQGLGSPCLFLCHGSMGARLKAIVAEKTFLMRIRANPKPTMLHRWPIALIVPPVETFVHDTLKAVNIIPGQKISGILYNRVENPSDNV